MFLAFIFVFKFNVCVCFLFFSCGGGRIFLQGQCLAVKILVSNNKSVLIGASVKESRIRVGDSLASREYICSTRFLVTRPRSEKRSEGLMRDAVSDKVQCALCSGLTQSKTAHKI